uniref:Transthyretin-like family protein n=1 Tax=Panagrellus redivivus TaxID=6233 RepID=A0A7E4ZRI4_PANRE
MSSYIGFLVLVLGLAVSSISAQGFSQQWVGVRGQVFCGTSPANNTDIRLFNRNRIGFDDQLAAVRSDANGNFQISGGQGAWFAVNARLRIYTSCNRRLPCDRVIDFGIPSQFVTRSNGVTNWYDLGVINLMTSTRGESTRCFGK